MPVLHGSDEWKEVVDGMRFLREKYSSDEESRRQNTKVYRDMYEGNGKDNPSMTTRMSDAEKAIERFTSNSTRAFWMGVGTLGSVLTLLIAHFIGK